MGGRYIYMASSSDRLETPLYVTDSAEDMAGYLGCSVGALYSRISKLRTGRLKCSKECVKVYLFPKEDDDD